MPSRSTLARRRRATTRRRPSESQRSTRAQRYSSQGHAAPSAPRAPQPHPPATRSAPSPSSSTAGARSARQRLIGTRAARRGRRRKPRSFALQTLRPNLSVHGLFASVDAHLAAFLAALASVAPVRRTKRRGTSRPALVSPGALVALVIVVASALTYTAVARGAPGWLTTARGLSLGRTPQPTPAIVVHDAFGTPTPTVPPQAYVVGAWVSDSAPLSSGSVRVYVRVTDYTSLTPVRGVSVTAQVQFTCATAYRVATYGPLPTGARGLASFEVTFTGLPRGQPICVTVFATVGGQTYTASATFAAR